MPVVFYLDDPIASPLTSTLFATAVVPRLRAENVTFIEADWNVVEDGATNIETRPLSNPSVPDVIPGYYAILRSRST